ncbi:ABC transporter permease [Ktedonosporobacter rubrisoli]|uniref:ABC transporter permease n=1 Tax=Ktedonosporobacter rubrisoli TaxID=2509675 RepID=A0A4V0Z014_KTERU|nr:ABC transporter permease [Ktedonosporobacter rubrisoli]QBD81631.1 ABC transporter permease [Ktedonosporobacter rubrisoli]
MKVISPLENTPQQKRREHSSTWNKAKLRALRQALLIVGGRLLLLVGLLLAWQFLSGRYINPLFISSPLAVARRISLWIADGTLWYHTEITLQETLLGLLLGLLSGVLMGFLLGLQPILARIFDPVVVALYSIPKVALAPLFILWFGIDIQMKVILAAVTVFFLVFFNTLSGVRNVDQNLIDAVLLMGGKRREMLFKVIIPSASSSVLMGFHISIPYALIGAVIAELIASNHGIGYLINDSATQFDTARVFAALFVLTVIAALLNTLVNFLDRKTSRWKVGIKQGYSLLP